MTHDLITLFTPQAIATLSPYGAQIMAFKLTDETKSDDMLWQTSPDLIDAARAAGKPLRGGVPVCWPWFGPHPSLPEAPNHGVARLKTWEVIRQAPTQVVLGLDEPATEAFPYPTRVTLTATLHGAVLQVALTTENKGDVPFQLTQALHTYLLVGDIETARVRGLEGLPCRHSVTGDVAKPAGPLLEITGEHDHVYAGIDGVIKVLDPTLERTLVLQHEGCTEALVFNPWADKAKRLDMPEDGYKTMLCVEAINLDDAPTLAPGATHTLSMRLWQQPYTTVYVDKGVK